jgi:FkbM family methyltransferase
MKINQLTYNFLIHAKSRARGPRRSRLWDRLWNKGLKTFSGPVETRIHGQKVVVDYGYTYPIYTRQFPNLNSPLVELAYQTWKVKGTPICFADVGAAVGDTVLLLYANLPNAFSGFVCVDGDGDFCKYLKQNLSHLPGGRIYHGILSATEEKVSNLVRTFSGSASAQGNERVVATTLSSVLTEPIDLLKIDVDGFDGRVLAGSQRVFDLYKPNVIFEWHPILCQKTGNNWHDAFNALESGGYSRFVWFNKFGDFSHFMFRPDAAALDALADYCLADVPADLHYDVVALHDSSQVNPQTLAELNFAKKRPSRF